MAGYPARPPQSPGAAGIGRTTSLTFSGEDARVAIMDIRENTG
jgi:hypothetical protein